MVSLPSCVALSAAAVRNSNTAVLMAESNRHNRVRVYTASGIQIGRPGVGEGLNRLTFPMRYLVGDALNGGGLWVRFATVDEIAHDHMQETKKSQWWRFSEIQPRTLIHASGEIAYGEQLMGVAGITMTGYTTEPQVKVYEDVAPADDLLESIATPPTPPPW